MQHEFKNFHHSVSRLERHSAQVKERCRRKDDPRPQRQEDEAIDTFTSPESHQTHELNITFSAIETIPIACPVPAHTEVLPARPIAPAPKRSFLSRLFDLSPRHPRKSNIEN